MAEEHTQQQSPRGKSRRERVEHARSRDILDVANELSMELVQSGRDYRWKEHDSMVISPEKNMWNWFSRHQGGDVIALVQTMKEVNFNQAIDFLNDGTFKEFTHVKRVQEPFTYYLQPYEQPFEAARDYLKEQRGLSDETIDFFLEKGVLAQANAKVNGSIEPVVVFKSFDFSGEIVGATLQGIEENWEKWPERGYAKNIVRNSDGITGMHVDIGQPNRLIFAESAIDLMSYYELHKDSLQDVRLISMDGVKEAVVGRHLAQLQSELSGRPLRWSHEQLADGLQTAIDNNFFADGNHADWITLAVDNDEAGRNFIDSLREKGASIVEDLPDLQPGQDKTDWNDTLKNSPNEFTDAVDELSVTVDQSSRINFLNQLNQNSAVTPVRPVTVLKQNELYSDYWRVYQSDGNLEFYLSEDGQFGYRQYGSLNPKEDNIIFKFHSKEETTDFLATQMGYDSLKYIVNKDWESLFDSDKALLRENYVFKDLENFLQNSNAFELDYWTFDDGLKQAQKVARQDEEFLNEITKKDLTKTRSEEQGGLFENLADATSTSDRAQVSYDTFKANQERLSEVVQSQIQAGALRITLSDEAYFYTLVNYTGWSHPMQQLKPKAVESLKEYRTFFESINDTNIDRFKEKGTPEQNQMYDLLKGLQKDLGRSSTSTVFSEEVAISAYNLNRRLNSLTAENWGKGITDPLGSLGRDTWNVISYPANDIVTDNTDYYDQLVPYHLLEYLNGKNGTVEISPETYETILQQLRDESIIITPEVVEDVTTSPEQVVSSSEETEKPLEVHQGQDVSEQQKKEVQLKDIRTLHREWEQELENKVTQFLGHTPQWWELERNRGAFITSELDQLFAKRSSLKLDAHFADNSQYVRQEIKQLDEQILTIIQQEKAPERTQEQAVSEQQKNERMYQRKGSLQPEAEGSTSPVLETSTFERSVTSRPTVSSQYLNFSIKDGFKSRKTKYEKSIDAYNLGKLNRRGIDIQEAAQFYLNELANSTVHYFTSDGSLVQVNFLEENFLHLTGLKIIGDAATPGKILHDFANGGELSYDDIRLKNTESPFDKIKVLPDLETVLQTDSFYFDDLQDIPRYQGRFDSLIKSDDSDLMLLFRMNTEDGTVPVSVFKARQVLRVELQEARKNEILGIFREKGGLIEQIDINKNYVKDDGEEMLSILKNRQYEESRDINDQSMNVSSYSFNHQDYSDIDSLLEAGSAYLQTTEGQEWLARDPEYHQELLDVFESAGATPKQKLEVMSEFGNIQVNGYDIVAGLGYSEALSDDALFFDQNTITEITEQGFVQEKPIQTRIDQQVSQQQLESLRNYFSGQMDKVEIGIGRSGAGVDYRAYYLRNSYDNRIEIAATDLGSELSPEEQLDALMNKIVENYGKSFWDLVQQPDFELSDEEAHQLAYPIVTQESLSEVFGYSPDVITEEKLQTPEPISAELFTQVLDSAYNVGDPRKLGLQVPEESKRAWERYYELSDSYEGNFSAVVDAADQLSLVDKNSNFYQDWQQDQIYNDTYHVRLRGSNEGLISPQWPFEPTHFVSYQDFVTELYKANQDASQTQPIAFDIYAPGGALIKDGVRYAVGDETQPVSRLLGLGYRRLEDYP
ncbi:MAG: PBECR4 domain-containing protein, partial [Streptococcus orisratti]|uniref:PBECR4 domain-containing protein n=1 Tax=Streptococcus orisratti TaxID=114652 RepID=UPI002352ECAB